MKLLLDTNIFLEVILNQEQAASVRRVLERPDEHDFFITDYSLHSIGLLLFRRKLHSVFDSFINDIIITTGVVMITLPAETLSEVTQIAKRFDLDFDDAYQYTAAERRGLTIISLDNDFDRTEKGKKTPMQLLNP